MRWKGIHYMNKIHNGNGNLDKDNCMITCMGLFKTNKDMFDISRVILQGRVCTYEIHLAQLGPEYK